MPGPDYADFIALSTRGLIKPICGIAPTTFHVTQSKYSMKLADLSMVR